MLRSSERVDVIELDHRERNAKSFDSLMAEPYDERGWYGEEMIESINSGESREEFGLRFGIVE